MPDIQPGRVLTHYQIVEKLGEGGMGVVWKAFDTKLNRYIALKVLRPELTADPERQRRFMREARAAAAVTHANIVTIHEVDEVDGTTFMCMELVEGRTLRTALTGHHPLPMSEALRIGAEIAEGLARAHRDGIVHRDLKPENVILRTDGHPKILDFGLAKLVESRQEALRSGLSQEETHSVELTGAGAILGTTAYMSPEQARGEPVDCRSDIFSIGVLLYELVTGHRPFNGSSQIAMLVAILHDPAVPASQFNADVPFRLEELLGKCLEKDPSSRYQTSDDLAVDLRRVRRDLESGASASSFTRPGEIGRPGHRPSIAVLPFQNLSTEAAHSYFAGGLHDELLTQLAKVAALKVISRTSVMGYQDTTKPLKVIGQELGVGSIVEGSVQVIGGRLRVNVQLIDALTDEHLWAERYDRTLDDAFAIQSDMAQQVVAAVGASLTGTEQAQLVRLHTTNAEAYQLYLQGREYHNRSGTHKRNLEIAGQLYERALLLDPNFALAHAWLSQVSGTLHWLQLDSSPIRAARQLQEAEVALRLAPNLPEAHAALGLSYYHGKRDFHLALRELAVALEGSPNDADLIAQIGYVHRRLGHWDSALAALETSTRLNPRSANGHYSLGQTYEVMHRYEDAVRAFDEALDLAPDLHHAAIGRGRSRLLWQGTLDALRKELDNCPPGGSYVFGYQLYLLLLERKRDALLEMLRTAPGDVDEGQYDFLPFALYAAWGHQLGGYRSEAQTAFASARVFMDSVVKEHSDDFRVHAARGLALAGLGLRDEALREAAWLEQSSVYREDVLGRASVAERRAQVLAQAGYADAAVDEIQGLLAGPSWISVHTLRLDPRWDPICEHPRFKALLG